LNIPEHFHVQIFGRGFWIGFRKSKSGILAVTDCCNCNLILRRWSVKHNWNSLLTAFDYSIEFTAQIAKTRRFSLSFQRQLSRTPCLSEKEKQLKAYEMRFQRLN
jgi:hypothetical protein